MREGGIRGGGVSELETLPRPYPMGINLDGSQGTDGMGSKNKHGMDAGHSRAAVPLGQMAHGADQARGGHYHCMAEGCDYKTRDKMKMNRHAGQKKRHSMGSSTAQPSSDSTPSSAAEGSSTSHGVAFFLRKITERY